MDLDVLINSYLGVMAELKSSVLKLDKSKRVVLEKDIAKMEKAVKEMDLDKIKEVAANLANYDKKSNK